MFLPAVLVAVFVLGSAFPVFAQTNASSVSSTKKAENSQATITRLIGVADKEIARRITALNTLSSRTQAMKKLLDAEKNNLSLSIQSQMNILNDLKTKIDADSDVATLRADVMSITKSYRIYALVIPQGAIVATADRVLTIVDAMNADVSKVQKRLSSLPVGTDTSSIQTALSDIAAKLADASTQAQTALSEVSSLVPDNGDTAKATANKQALTDARSKIKTASQDIQAARKDFTNILKGFLAISKANRSTSTPASVPANPQ